MNVAGKRMKVDLSRSGVPGEFDLLVVRDAMVVNPNSRKTSASAVRKPRRGSCARFAAASGSTRKCWMTASSSRSTTTFASAASEVSPAEKHRYIAAHAAGAVDDLVLEVGAGGFS
jgi:hypothetical protein